jgi:hypothetical protein
VATPAPALPLLALAVGAGAGARPDPPAFGAPAREVLLLATSRSRVPGGGARAPSAYQARRVDLRHAEVPDGHSWGHWRATVAPMLEFLYGRR